jgi:hypothetical protein
MAFAGQAFQREQPALALGADRDRHRGRAGGVFLDQRIPLAAGFAFARPAVIRRAAILADKGEGGLGHARVNRFRCRTAMHSTKSKQFLFCSFEYTAVSSFEI